MKIKSFFTLLLILNFSQLTFAQHPMDEGFRMLENGEFDAAAKFFKNYLTKDPKNKTALLCYGRGIGLSGQTDEAKDVFRKLQADYPNDYEIDLNYAEAFMWGKNYQEALKLYEKLVERDSSNFAALLGLANAFSENKNYDQALKFVQKALDFKPGNANAETSQKYMRLGKASVLANKGDFKQAVELLDLILLKNPHDADALINKAQILQTSQNYKQSSVVYQKLVGLKAKKIDGYLGLSTIANLQKHNEVAMQWAQQAVMYADSTNKLKAQLGLVNAYGWNKNFNQAFNLLADLNQKYPDNLEVLSAFGRLSIWSKNFNKGAKYYTQLLAKMPSSFDGNLGLADANHAQSMDNMAYKFVRKTLDYYPNQRDALQFLERLQLAHYPALSTHTYWSHDNGGNISSNYKFSLSIDPTALIRASLFYYKREAENIKTVNNIGKLSIEQAGIGAEIRLTGFLKIGASGSILKTAKQQNFISEINSTWKLGRFQNLEVKYNEELQTFTAELISRNLKMKNSVINYNLSLPSKIGLYTQMIHTKISDGNTRDLLFASLYYDFTQAPVFKVGLNFSTFAFKKQLPEVYFSPNLFKGYEVFAAAENVNEAKAKWLYQAIIAGGLQKISNEKHQGTYRFDVKTGWKFSNRLNALLYFMRSNSAASSVQGFTYNEWGIKAKYIIPARCL